MAAVISKELCIEAVLVKGDKGIFDVVADGALIFSKYKEGRFPNPGEIAQMLHGRDAGAS